MSYIVRLHVAFECDDNAPVAELAAKHLHLGVADGDADATYFLSYLATRTGTNPGPKGGLSLWGIRGNYSNGSRFCDILIPFWKELGSGDQSPYEGTNVLVFEEAEQSAGLTVYEVSLGTKPIESTEYACSCSWEQ